MQKKYMQGVFGCLGLAVLAALSINNLPMSQSEQADTVQMEQKELGSERVQAYATYWTSFEKERFRLSMEKPKEEVPTPVPVEMDTAAVSEGGAIVSEPAVESIQPVPEPNTQVVVAAPEPTPEPAPSENGVQIPVTTSVEAPGGADITEITVTPVVEEPKQPEPTPDTSSSPYTEAEQMASIQGGCMIMGSSYTYLEQMVRYYCANESYPEYYQSTDAPTIEDFCRIYIEEAQAEGVRAEVAFCQAMKETGFLRYLGDVRIEQFNFAGIGATGGGVQGNYFPDVRSGIRAQIQHLKAYASYDSLKGVCVDPRFSYVQRGTTPYVEWLGIHENPNGGGWAAAENYGNSIVNDYIAKLFGH